MGLGLTICKMILERHNGQISIAQVHLTAWRFAWSCLLLPIMPIHGTMSGQKGKSGDAIATYRFSLKADIKRRSREIRKMPASHVATHRQTRTAAAAVLRVNAIPIQKIDLVERAARLIEEQHEPQAISQIVLAGEINAGIGHGRNAHAAYKAEA